MGTGLILRNPLDFAFRENLYSVPDTEFSAVRIYVLTEVEGATVCGYIPTNERSAG